MTQEESEQNIERLELRKKEKAELLHKKLGEKQAKQQGKENEQETKRQAKEHEEKLQLERLELRKKEKAELLHKKRDEKQARHETKEGERGEERREKAELIDERKKAKETKQINAVVRIAAEVKEQRILKVLNHKMQKERKTEKEEQKFKANVEKKARKEMELHLGEEVIKEEFSGQVERVDIFVGLDSIDQETADLLLKSGYTSIEKLQDASVKDLMKIGLKKKTAQMILAESEKFVGWEVYDAPEYPKEKI
jgi:hypothetical protein